MIIYNNHILSVIKLDKKILLVSFLLYQPFLLEYIKKFRANLIECNIYIHHHILSMYINGSCGWYLYYNITK